MKNALVVNADGTHEVIDVSANSLSTLQNAVDGLIQPIDISDTITMWVNEEFLFRNSFEPNLLATAMYQNVGGQSVIPGSVVFTGGADSEGNTMGLDDSELDRLNSLAKVAQLWVDTGTMV